MLFSNARSTTLCASVLACSFVLGLLCSATTTRAEDPAEAKPAEVKVEPSKPAEATPAEAKPEEAKPAEATPAEEKPEEAKPPEKTPEESAVPEPRLRFNFRFQRWVEVLQWVARQADLSLVLDAPPPGTFNYSDAREYTPVEAIDLLNGVLLTKGYTLIRRQRMLMLINLKDGVPEGLVPRVTMEELNKRGKFELVSVLFPLGRRSADEVDKEITPLLGPHGKSVSLPKTSQLLITDTAGIMKAIGTVIESIPEPPLEPSRPKRPEKEPYLEVYAIDRTEAAKLLNDLKQLIPKARLTIDPKTGKLAAWCRPDDHATIATILEKLGRGGSPETTPQLEVHRLTVVDPTATLSMLRTLLPDAQLVLDPKTRSLLALAVPADQRAIRTTLDQLQGEGVGAAGRQLRVYPLVEVPPPDLVAGLKELAPRAQIMLEPKSKRLIVVASAADHAGIKAALEQVEKTAPAEQATFAMYAIHGVDPRQLLRTLQPLVPTARLTIDAKTKKLVVWATAREHEVLAKAVDQLQRDTSPLETPQLVVYPLTRANPATTMALLRGLVPNAQLAFDTQTNRLIVMAVPADQQAIRTTLAQLQPERLGPDAPQLRFYPLAQVPPPSLITGLQKLAPKAQVSLEAAGRRLMVVATPADHEVVKATIERLEAILPDEESRFEVYTVHGADAAGLVATLRPLAPGARLTVDPKTNNLLVWATAREHETLKKAVGRLGRGGAAEFATQLEVYRLTKADPASTLTLLRGLVPGARLSIDAPTRSVIAVATERDHRTIKTTLEQLESDEPRPDATQLQYYPLLRTPPPTLLRGLQQLAPGARLTYDAAGKRLLVVASPAEQKIVKQALERFEQTAPPEQPNRLVSYAVTAAQRKRFEAVLPSVRAELPDIRVITDAEPGELSIWAKPMQHEVIGRIIEQLKRDVPAEQKYRLVAYQITLADPANVLVVMRQLFPGTQLTLDSKTKRLLAWAGSEEHKKIKAAMEEMDANVPADVREKLMVYPMADVEPWVAITVLRHLVPDARLTPDSTAGTMVAWAREADHKIIAQTIKDMQVGPGAAHKPRIEVYSTGDGDPTVIGRMLRTLVPTARLTPDPQKGTVAAWATPKEHETIRAAIEKMARREDAETAPAVATYSLGTTPLHSAMRVLRAVVPRAQIAVGAEPDQLVVWARPADHKRIEQIVKQLTETGSGETARKVVVYPLVATTANKAIQVLRKAVPGATLNVGSDPYQLVAWARPADHETIKRIVEELSKKAPAEKAAKVVVYTLESTNAWGAIAILRPQFPQARFSAGTDPYQLIVSARPADHERIKQVVEELSKKAPAEKAAKVVVYTLESTTARSAIPVLQTQFRQARFTVGTDPYQLIVSARPADHERIKQVVEELSKKAPAEKAAKVVVYTLESVTAWSAIRVLQPQFPQARFSAGTDPYQLIAWARPADQERIKQVVDELSKEAPTEKAAKVVVYTLESTTARSAIPVLQTQFRQARFSAGTDPYQLIVSARPADHERIKQVVEELSKEAPADKAAKVVVYTLRARLSYTAIRGLREAFPQARCTSGADPRQLIVLARPPDHEKIKDLIEQMSKKETAPSVVIYRLKSAGAAQAVKILGAAFPEAKFTTGANQKSVIAWARPDEHVLIKTAVEQIEAAGSPDDDRVMAVHSMKAEDAASLLQVLDPLLKKHARFVTAPDRDSLIVWADKEHQAVIKRAVEQFLSKLPELRKPVSEVYYFRTADPREAMTVLRALVPTARMAANIHNRSLVVSALAEDQEKIKEAVEQIDREVVDDQAPRLQSHRIVKADPVKLFDMLKTFYRRRGDVQLTLDEENDTIMAIASPTEHENIQSLIRQVEAGASPETTAGLVVYPLKNVDSVAVMQVLDTLLEKERARVRMSVEPRSNQLVVIARPDQHKIIRDTIEQLRIEEKQLEIYQLDVLEPSTAELAIDRLFNQAGYGRDPTMPIVDADEDTQQLFISATKEQHAKIRDLLIKMGETGLKLLRGDRGKMRVVPFQGDSRAAIEEIKRVWPQLRKNPIRIGKPSDAAPTDEPQKIRRPGRDPAAVRRSRFNPPGHDPAYLLVGLAEPEPAVELPPVTLVPGRRNITIMSDDPEALDQMESLLRSLSRPTAYSGRKFSVFPIQHTDVTEIAAKLRELFRTMRPRWQRSRDTTMIVADERLGAVVVRANRPDRAMIEELIEVLDTPESPESLAARQPKLIGVKNTRAAQIEGIIKRVFHTQLNVARQGRSGARSSVFAPRLSVDEVSNSLVLTAPEPLFTQISQLIATLDAAAGDDSARALRIISLKKINASRVQKALDAALERPTRRNHR